MSNYIPISGLNELTIITADDFLAFVDSGSLTTYRGSVTSLKNFFAASGSVLSSSWASSSISASHTIQSDSASYLYPRLYQTTASWAQNVVFTTVVGTASLAYNARTASRLEGIGSSTENVFSINSSLTTADGAYLAITKRANVTSSVGSLTSLKANSLFLNKDYIPGGTTGYGKLYFLDNGASKLVFEVGDTYTNVNVGPNVDLAQQQGRGFLFQTNEAGNVDNLLNTGSLLFISSSGRTYGRIFEALEFSSSKAVTGGVGFYGTASYATYAAFSLATANIVPAGMIVGFAGALGSIPTGWLNCDGSQYDPVTYPNLSALFGQSFGPALTINVFSHPETITTYHTAADGYVTLTWVSGGSGIFSLTWGASTYYINSTTANFVTFTGLSGPVTYPYTWTDYGVTPNTSYPRTVAVTYGGGNSSTNVVLNSATYRLPQISSYYFLQFAYPTPIYWILKY